MKVQEVILRAMAKRLTWWEAAEILGISARQMRRWKWRYETYGYDGLLDRRRGQPSPKRVPLATVQEVLRLFQQRYSQCNVSHFHEKLREEHGITLSYQWVKTALQTAGLVRKRARRAVHRRRRERRPLRGMLLHVDGSTHAWIPALAGQRQDLIAIVDDATSEVYAAFLVEQEGTLSVMRGLREVVQRQGVFCSLYTDRGSHFFHTPKVGGAVDKTRVTQIGRALSQLGIQHIPSYSPQARGRMERFFGSWQGRLPQELALAGVTSVAQANRFIRQKFMPWHNRRWAKPAREAGSAFVPLAGQDVEAIFSVQSERVVGNDNTVVVDRRRLQLEPTRWRCSFAQCRVVVCEHLDGTWSVRHGPHLLGHYDARGVPLGAAAKRAAA